MRAASEHLVKELSKLRSGRAAPGTSHVVMPDTSTCSMTPSCRHQRGAVRATGLSAVVLTRTNNHVWVGVGAGLIESIPVKVYGESMPLKDVALISTRDAQTLVVSLYDASVRPATLTPCFRIQPAARFAHPLFFDTP